MKKRRSKSKYRRYYTKTSNKNLKSSIKKIMIVLIIGFVIAIFFTGENGTLKLIKLYFESERMEKNIKTISTENDIMKKEINSLKYDKKAVEKEARKRLGFVKKGEIIYRFK